MFYFRFLGFGTIIMWVCGVEVRHCVQMTRGVTKSLRLDEIHVFVSVDAKFPSNP